MRAPNDIYYVDYHYRGVDSLEEALKIAKDISRTCHTNVVKVTLNHQVCARFVSGVSYPDDETATRTSIHLSVLEMIAPTVFHCKMPDHP